MIEKELNVYLSLILATMIQNSLLIFLRKFSELERQKYHLILLITKTGKLMIEMLL